MPRIRDVKKGVEYAGVIGMVDEVQVITIEELHQRERLAGWYARKAGMDSSWCPTVTMPYLTHNPWPVRLRWFGTGIALATVYLLMRSVAV